MRFPPESEIKRLRKSLDITQLELARLSGVSQSTIAKRERGGIKGSYETVTKIFIALQEVAQAFQGQQGRGPCHPKDSGHAGQ